MTTETKNQNQEPEVIFVYTRQQAIEDGELADLWSISEEVKGMCQSLYKYPVAVTRSIWAIIQEAVDNKEHHNDLNGVIWDILYMSQHYITRRISPACMLFEVAINGVPNRYPRHKQTEEGNVFVFKIMCHGGDQGEPVLTIMQPDED